MPVIPLVTLSQVTGELSGVLPRDQSTLPALILAASRAIQKYAKRDFAYWTYDEMYSGNGFRDLILKQYPLNRVRRLSCNLLPALAIVNKDAVTNQIATVSSMTVGDTDSGLVPVGLSLSAVASGVTTTYAFLFNPPPIFTFTVAASGTGGTIASGVYLVAYAIVGSSGESVPCPTQAVTVATGQVLSFSLPLLPIGATGYSLYVSTANGNAGTMTRQVTGVATSATLTALVSGAAPSAAANVTVGALASAINGLGTAWVASPAQGYSLYPTSDFRPILGVQGALGASNPGATLDLCGTELAGYLINYNSGILSLGPNDIYDPVFSLSGSAPFAGFPQGNQNIRVVYDAGYTTVPADIQQAVILTIQDWIWQIQTVRIFKKETGDRYSYEFFNRQLGIPDVAKSILQNGWLSYRTR